MQTDITTLVRDIHDTPTIADIVVSGAGTSALSWLLSVPGASRTVLEAQVPYASRALTSFLGRDLKQYVNVATAKEMANVAYIRAVDLKTTDGPAIGLACTAAIATDRPRRGSHRCHVALWTSSGTSTHSLVMTKGARDRFQEEQLVGRLILNVLGQACKVDTIPTLPIRSEEKVDSDYTEYADPIEALLSNHIKSTTLDSDGHWHPSQKMRGGIFPGSFNPLHNGHETLARVATEVLQMEVTYELSATNVDKHSLDHQEVKRRLLQFNQNRSVVLTQARVFADKAVVFPGCTFVIGSDTLTRLLDKKYYQNSEHEMYASLSLIKDKGCSFLVAGRMIDGIFRTLSDISLPPIFHNMFTEIPENMFRLDCSSSELRLSHQTWETQ